MYGALDVSTSGMIAQRTRLEVAAANIANKNTVLDSAGRVNPYRRRVAYFAPGDPSAKTAAGRERGVHVREIGLDAAPFKLQYDPSNPYAYQDGPNKGYVPMPNIDPVIENINAMEASRAYEANLAAAEATKTMMAQALRLVG